MPDKGPGPLFISEPASQYTRYPPLVVDCSVLTTLLDHDLVSVTLKKFSSGSREAANQALQDLTDLRLTRCAVDSAAQFELAQRMKLTAYDAAYLQLALDLRAPLATFDHKLARAAEKMLSKV